MEIVCQQCGDKGYENAFVYCVNCLNLAIHRYCLPTIPETFDEFVNWLCIDCDPDLVSGSHSKSNDCFPCSILQKSSEEEASPDLIKQPQATFSSPALEINSEKTTEKAKSRAGRNRRRLRKTKLKKKNGTTCTSAETGEQRDHTSDSCKSLINVDLTGYGLKHDSSVVKVSKKIRKNAETVDEGCENRANLEIDLSSLINSKENCTASTVAGTKEETCEVICLQHPSELPTEHVSNVGGSSPMCENLNVEDGEIDVRDRRLMISEERSKVGGEVVTTEVPNSLEAHDGFDQNYYLPAQPIIDTIWRGSFSISFKNYGLGDAVVGHLSSKACPKVCEEAGLLPTSLCLELLPKKTLWPKSFQISEPTDDNIGIYFFPRRERFRKSFDRLIEDMIRRELAMRAVVKNAELLVFTSSELPLQYWKFQENYFLWGVFRAKQTPSPPEEHHLVVRNSRTESSAPLNSPNDVGTDDSESSGGIKKTNILHARSPLSPLSNTCSSGVGSIPLAVAAINHNQISNNHRSRSTPEAQLTPMAIAADAVSVSATNHSGSLYDDHHRSDGCQPSIYSHDDRQLDSTKVDRMATSPVFPPTSDPFTSGTLVMITTPPSTHKLKGENFIKWKMQIEATLQDHGLIGFVDGTTPQPPQFLAVRPTLQPPLTVAPPATAANQGHPTGSEPLATMTVTESSSTSSVSSNLIAAANPTYTSWFQQDKLIFSFLVSTLSPEVLSHVTQCITSAQIWSTLHKVYTQQISRPVSPTATISPQVCGHGHGQHDRMHSQPKPSPFHGSTMTCEPSQFQPPPQYNQVSQCSSHPFLGYCHGCGTQGHQINQCPQLQQHASPSLGGPHIRGPIPRFPQFGPSYEAPSQWPSQVPQFGWTVQHVSPSFSGPHITRDPTLRFPHCGPGYEAPCQWPPQATQFVSQWPPQAPPFDWMIPQHMSHSYVGPHTLRGPDPRFAQLEPCYHGPSQRPPQAPQFDSIIHQHASHSFGGHHPLRGPDPRFFQFGLGYQAPSQWPPHAR